MNRYLSQKKSNFPLPVAKLVTGSFSSNPTIDIAPYKQWSKGALQNLQSPLFAIIFFGTSTEQFLQK